MRLAAKPQGHWRARGRWWCAPWPLLWWFTPRLEKRSQSRLRRCPARYGRDSPYLLCPLPTHPITVLCTVYCECECECECECVCVCVCVVVGLGLERMSARLSARLTRRGTGNEARGAVREWGSRFGEANTVVVRGRMQLAWRRNCFAGESSGGRLEVFSRPLRGGSTAHIDATKLLLFWLSEQHPGLCGPPVVDPPRLSGLHPAQTVDSRQDQLIST
jgi:hypothetical protein